MKIKLLKGQTAIEYLLVSLALTISFAIMYKAMHYYLSEAFKYGGAVILKMYTVTPYGK